MSGDVLTTAAGSAPGKAYYFDELKIGQKATFSREVTEAHIKAFAEVSGDNNPVHMDPKFAAEHTPFGGCIAHGILSASYISTVVGTILPGPGAIYINQSLKFRAPVKAGDVVVTEVELTDLIEKRGFAQFDTRCLVNGKVVLEGQATMMPPKR
ncbi:MAG: MaoC family dehydratase [Magnetovibrio sp.]|nr:MaoC family dehydratase [Magnetovibrio sp.]